MPASWKPEVFVEGAWSANGLRFATKQEAADRAADLFRRWTLCEDHRAGPSDDPVNYALIDGVLTATTETGE